MDIYYAVKYISNNKITPSKGAALREEGVILKLSNKYPIIAVLDVSGQNTGHTMIIYHYSDTTGEVKAIDPDIGALRPRPYLNLSELLNGTCVYSDNITLHWTRTVSISRITE